MFNTTEMKYNVLFLGDKIYSEDDGIIFEISEVIYVMDVDAIFHTSI